MCFDGTTLGDVPPNDVPRIVPYSIQHQRPRPLAQTRHFARDSDGVLRIRFLVGASVRFVGHAFVLAGTLTVGSLSLIGVIKQDGSSIRSCDPSAICT